MIHFPNSLVRCALAILVLAAPPSASGFAQEPAAPPVGSSEEIDAEPSDAEVRANMRRMLKDLELIRYSDGGSFSAVGNEQGGNDLRSGTPALAQHDDNRPTYDDEELSDRWRDLYAGEGDPSRPPRQVQRLERPQRLAKKQPLTTSDLPARPEPEQRSLWIYPVVGGVGLGLFLYARMKARS
jgi:hypothetical protein